MEAHETAMPQFLTVEEVAAMLRATPSAIYTQRYRGEEPGSLGFRIGRRILFRWSDLERFLSEAISDAPLAGGRARS